MSSPSRSSLTSGRPREVLLAELQRQRQRVAEPPAPPAPAPLPLVAQRSGPVRVGDLLSATDPLLVQPECPHPRIVEDFVAGRLKPARVADVRAHLTQCAVCRAYALGLREAVARPVPTGPPPPSRRPVLGTAQVLGLTFAALLLMLANTAALDLLGALETAPPAMTAAAEVDRTVVAPAPLAAPPVLAAPALAPAPAAESLLEPPASPVPTPSQPLFENTR